MFGPSRAAVTSGAVLRGIRASPRSLFPFGESGTKFDSSTLFESKLLRWDVKACTLRAVPHYAQMEYGEQNPSLNHGWVGRQTTHLNDIDSITRFGEGVPETTPRSPAPSRRREAPSVAVAAVAVAAAAAVVVAAAIAKILFCSWLLGTGQPCSRDCHARL